MSVKVIIPLKTAKQIQKINPADQKKISRKLHQLKEEPLLGKPLKGELAGYFSLKAWPLRIIYTFDQTKQVIKIMAIGYRGDIYKNLKQIKL